MEVERGIFATNFSNFHEEKKQFVLIRVIRGKGFHLRAIRGRITSS